MKDFSNLPCPADIRSLRVSYLFNPFPFLENVTHSHLCIHQHGKLLDPNQAVFNTVKEESVIRLIPVTDEWAGNFSSHFS